jgi:sigma-B regulation protein RsbU (phosphoserine phosphatase)
LILEPIAEEAVNAEFNKSTEKFHTITCWIGIILNVVWFISDYFVLPDHWLIFLDVRILVSSVSFIALVTRKKTGLSIYTCVFFLVLGISLQNAYMWSVMDLATMQKHTFAYIALFIGAGMLVLWEFKYSLIAFILSLIGNIFFLKINSKLSVEELTINGGLLTLTVAIISMFLIRSRRRLTINEIRSRLELSRSKELIQQEHAIVEEKNKEITDSINYAKRIQSALIPSETEFGKHFKESFVLFKPKDIVSGDFYWIFEKDDKLFYVTADCTGHGVPGGFMTMLGLTFLEEIIAVKGVTQPQLILDELREKIINTLKQTSAAGENKDGMDITLCCVNKKNNSLTYSSANNSLYILRGGILNEHKGDKQPCGFFPNPKPFTSHEVKLEAGDCIYTYTDGFADQFGGKSGKKFKYQQFEELLVSNHGKRFAEQKELLNTSIDTWRGKLEQVDDILVIGVKVV